jgi:hypothetical protein
MATDKGGGARGGGGKLADSVDNVTYNLVDNRVLVDYSINKKTTDQAAISPLDLTKAVSELETDQYIIVGVGVDFLFASPYIGGEAQDTLVQVSIPNSLRKSFWDGKVIGNWTYSFTSYGTRKKTNGVTGAIIEEYLAPAYEVGEIIFAARSNTADGNVSLTVEHNEGGRSWRPFTDRRMVVTAVGDDTLTCSALEDPTEIRTVAKPHTLRRSPWDGVAAIDGVTYKYTSQSTRTAKDVAAIEPDEDQLVIPKYVANKTEILVAQGVTPFAYGEFVTYLYDTNDGRAWAKVPA